MTPLTKLSSEAKAVPAWLKLAPFIFILFWSGGFTAAKVGLNYAGPYTILCIRYFLVALVFAALFMVFTPPLPKTKQQWFHTAFLGFLLQVVHFLCLFQAILFGLSAGGLAVIASMQPILIALLSPKITGEKISKHQWIGFLLGLGGALIVVINQTDINFSSTIGILFAVGALLTITVVTLAEKRFGGNHHPISVNFIQYTIGFIFTFPLALFIEKFHYFPQPEFYYTMFYLIVCNSIIAVSLLFAMIKFGEASKVSSLFFLVPPTAALIAWLFVGEVLTPWAWAGIVIAAIGVSMVRSQSLHD